MSSPKPEKPEESISERLAAAKLNARTACERASQLAARVREVEERTKKLETFLAQVEERAAALHHRIQTLGAHAITVPDRRKN